MQSNSWICSSLLVVAFSFGFYGCGTSSKGPAPEAGHEYGEHDHSAHDHGSKIVDQLAKLSPEDRALAEMQKTCPVTGEPLGSMGMPLKVAVGDREVFVCCKGCKKPLENDPVKFLDKQS